MVHRIDLRLLGRVRGAGPMNASGEQILACLHTVASERGQRNQDPVLAACTAAVKAYQHRRFAQTYADMLGHQRYAGAARFFLEDLYGPGDFTSRDDQFARIVPALVKLFPRDIVSTVLALAQLHALSERLDGAMGRALKDGTAGRALAARVDTVAERYGPLWRSVGRPEEREQQIALMLKVGQALEGYTRKPLLRQTLKLMRGPAQAAGLGALQTFLERGFDTFRQMGGASEFLAAIAKRERGLVDELFAGADAPLLHGAAASTTDAGEQRHPYDIPRH